MALWSPRRHRAERQAEAANLWKASASNTDQAPASMDLALGATSSATERALVRQGMGSQLPFSPGRPLSPFMGAGSEPRQFDFRTGRNITAQPRSDEPVSFDTLRQVLRCYDFANICVRHRVDDITSLEYTLHPLDDEDKNVDTAIAAARAKLAKPDGRRRFKPWLKMYLNDVFRYDAGALYRMRDHADRVIGLKVIDGTSISPLVDYFGDIPEDDAPAFVQFANGVAWDWMTAGDMIYEPLWPQSDSPYGQPPIEQILLRANTDIRFQLYFLNAFTEGAVPAGFMEAPADMTDPDKVEDLQARWDAVMKGDQTRKWEIRWVPNGSKFTAYHDLPFDDKFPLFLMHVCAAAFGVTPNDLGFTDNVNKATGETQIDVQFRIGSMPPIEHVEGLLDSYIQDDLGLPVKGRFDTGQEKEDRLKTAQVWAIGIDHAAVSPDEMREEVFGLKVDPSMPVPRFIMSTRGGPIPVSALDAVAGEIDPATFAPPEGAVLPVAPFAPIEGVLPNPPPKMPALATQLYGTEDTAADTTGGDDVGAATGDPIAAGRAMAKRSAPVAAGLVVKAADTGRVLLLQRAMVDGDPVAGCWEFPGGHIDPGEGPLEAALREWSEEIGLPVPTGRVCGGWTSGNGVYRAFILVVAHENDVALNTDPGARLDNPDDPDRDFPEVAAWWDPAEMPTMTGLRPECLGSDWAAIAAAGVRETMAKAEMVGRLRDAVVNRLRPDLERLAASARRVDDARSRTSTPIEVHLHPSTSTTVQNTVQAAPAPPVTVLPAQVNVTTPAVTVEGPTVNVAPAEVTVQPPDIHVDGPTVEIQPAEVSVHLPPVAPPAGPRRTTAHRNDDGSITVETDQGE